MRCTAQNLPRCASGGGVRGKEINPALTLGEEEEEGKEGRGSRITLGPSYVRTRREQGPRVPRSDHPLQSAAGPAGTQPTHPRRRLGGGETRVCDPGERGHSPQHAEPSSSTTRGNISAAAGRSPPAPPQVSGAAAAAVTGSIGRHRRHGQDRTPPSVTSRTRRPGCLAARTRAPAPHARSPPFSRRANRARALAPARPPGLLTRRPPALRA